eukprot:700947-Prymnesium_polylepis.1
MKYAGVSFPGVSLVAAAEGSQLAWPLLLAILLRHGVLPPAAQYLDGAAEHVPWIRGVDLNAPLSDCDHAPLRHGSLSLSPSA